MRELLGGICRVLCWPAAFVFVFGLVYAVREAVRGGDKDVMWGTVSACGLLAMLGACLL